MKTWISDNYEKNIKLWYQQVKEGKTDTLCIKLTNQNDFLELQNFFLICQKEPAKSLRLEIQCESEDEIFRVRHYLYICRELAKEIWINGIPYKEASFAHFFKILPLTCINKNNFHFLSMKTCDIEEKLGINIGAKLLKLLEKEIKNRENPIECGEPTGVSLPLTNEEIWLLITALSCLYGEIRGLTDIADARREFFEQEDFKEKVHDMPFIAFLIFAIYDRVNHEEIAAKYKDKQKAEKKQKRYRVIRTEIPEALPSYEEIIADIFNAWDLSDGILQLLENVVEHAGDNAQSEDRGSEHGGLGVFSIRIHENTADNEFLHDEFDQYFKGYENKYRRQYGVIEQEGFQDRTEKEHFAICHDKLQNELKQGRFVEEKYIEEYEIIRKKIEERRKERNATKYFLDIQISDMSGKNMCEVFKSNLIKQGYSDADDFNETGVRSFFDSTDREEKIFEKYYNGKNIIHHYGLQIFTSVVVNNDGVFHVRSHSAEKQYSYDTTCITDGKDLIPLIEGTRYRILLPFRRQPTNTNTMVNANISYHMKKLEKKQILDKDKEQIATFYQKLKSFSDKKTKEEMVCELSETLKWEENSIYVFDAKQIDKTLMEIFCKSLILFVTEGKKLCHQNNIAIINCTTSDFVNIIRFFAVCYDKNGSSNWMRDTQIYLSGEDTREEFLLSGGNVNTLLVRVNKLAFSRRIHPMCIQTLQKVLEKKGQGNLVTEDMEEEAFQYTPFDLLLYKDGRTLFENNVRMVLENNIQNVDSGCKIEPTHTRIGSKIHIDAFYEAELLFYNSYYTNRFAYLLFDKLEENLQKQGWSDTQEMPICFVGYETYSEMLLCELKRIWMEQYKTDCIYVVYEIRTDGTINLRYKELMSPNMQYVLVVPINSTLTTFNKVRAEIRDYLDGSSEVPILAYLGAIQVRDCNGSEDDCSEMEKEYWDKKDIENRKIYSKKLLGENKYADFLVDVQCTWENPLQCKQCFPKDCLFEMPLIETNKASVVPTQLIGLKEESQVHPNRKRTELEHEGNIDSLKDFFYCGHIARGSNHFRYYIRTAHYFKHYQKEVREWLSDVKNAIKQKRKSNVVSFDIIVNPMHFSNTAFVEAVNEVVFDGASYVLRIESEKEFRDNIQTKYSDLGALYENLSVMGNDTEINFYYVDDNIITGKSFYRIRHLVNSIFPVEKRNVKIFSAVIVLLNRLSSFSINNYVEDIDDYYSYINLNISNLRSYEDACYLCKREMDNKKLAGYASTNAVYKYWEDDATECQLKPLSKTKEEYQKERENGKTEAIEQKCNRQFLRLKATHEINQQLGSIGLKKNNSIEVYKVLVRQLEVQSDKYETMLANLYVSANPFIVYRKSCREAVFRMMIILFEAFVNGDTYESLKDRICKGVEERNISKIFAEDLSEMLGASKKIIANVKKETKNTRRGIEFLKFLIELSVELKCNYIIRPDRMSIIVSKFFDLSDYLTEEMKIEERRNFKIFFTASVKKLIALNADESKNTRLEEILYPQLGELKWSKEEEYKDKTAYLAGILIALYLENTSGLVDAIKDLVKKQGKTEGYFLDNYFKILEINGIEEGEKQSLLSKQFQEIYVHLNSSIGESSEYERQTERDFHKYIKYYNDLAVLIKQLTKAKRVQFLLSHNEWVLKIAENHDVIYDQEKQKYEVFAHSEKAEVVHCFLKDEEIHKMAEQLMLETVSIDQQYVLVKYTDYNRGIQDNLYVQSIYMLMEYQKEISCLDLSYIKRILLYRNMMMQRFTNDFSNNVMQNWIKQSQVIEQLEKARAFIHTRDNGEDEASNVWLRCKAFFYGSATEIAEQEQNYGHLKDGYILQLMTDIRIGRINILLLSNSVFQKDTYTEAHPFRLAKGGIECLRKTYYWNDICICDEKGAPRTNEIINDTIYDANLEKNKDGYYNQVNEYLIYLIYEAIHSAAIYGKEVGGKVSISIYKEGIYLYICNEMKDEKKIEDIYNGIARKGKGISLAVVCEYFLKEYEDRYVKIYAENGKFKIGLPIFTEDKENGIENLSN